MGENEKEGRDFPFGKVSGTAAVTSGIGLTTCRINHTRDITEFENYGTALGDRSQYY